MRRFSFSLRSLMTALIMTAVIFISLGSVSAYISILRKSLFDIAAASSVKEINRAAASIERYTDYVRGYLDNFSGKIRSAKSRGELSELLRDMSEAGSDISGTFVYGENGKVLDYSAPAAPVNSNPEKDFFHYRDYFISSPHAASDSGSGYSAVITAARGIWSDLYNCNVYLALDIKFTAVSAYLNNVGTGEHGYCFLADMNGEILFSPLSSAVLATDEINEIKNRPDGVFSDGNIIYAKKTIESAGWTVVGISFLDELAGNSIREAVNRNVIVSVICVIIALVLVGIFSKTAVKPMSELIYAMREFENNAESFEYHPVYGPAEINTLSDSFGHMVKRIQKLMEKVKEEEISLRKTELTALQAQINPHFLYNTLDSIQWMCEEERTKDAVKMLSALAKLFRISISGGRELITVSEELNHAKCYLIIQSYRYKNKFSFSFEADDDILSCLCSKITLQPLIENAIYHGISGTDEDGKITVSAKKSGANVIFTVKDNGVGMTKEQCENILTREPDGLNGIGIKNVCDRIKIIFGEQYGVFIESEVDKGTEIKVIFPALTSVKNHTL